jgi:pantoate--beta-alanine ligase
MGYLHAGHRRLLEEGRRRGDRLVLSLFVNPTQFGEGEDFEHYPRDQARDDATAEAAGVDLLFAPGREEMYPNGELTTVVAVPDLGDKFCGASRPGHFAGVATVVTKLFQIVRPHVAIFGEKDYQQLVIVRRLARDLDLGVEVEGIETVREPDGLAMSSRNVYLTPEDREAALSLSCALRHAQEQVSGGERSAASIARKLEEMILWFPQNTIDYVAIVDPETLEEVNEIRGAARVLLAVRVRDTRLIDNGPLETGN